MAYVTASKLPEERERRLVESSHATVLHKRADLEGATWLLLLIRDMNSPVFARMHDELAGKSVYPNIFFEPPFMHLASRWIARHKVRGLALVERQGEDEQLKFFAPVTLERTGRVGPKFMRVWSNEFAPLSQPLIDRHDEERVVEELFHGFANTEPSIARGLLINSLPADTAFASHFIRQGSRTGNLRQFNRFERAALKPVKNGSYSKHHLSGKRRQRLRVARKRLEEVGAVTFDEAVNVSDAEVAMLDFLYLENRGWKGKRKSALASNPKTRQFSMDVVRKLAGRGQCRIFSLQLEGVVIASMVMLVSRGHHIPWKIAFDERYAKYSVGNLLLVHVNDRLSENRDFLLLDSVATGDNENANRFWPDRVELCSLATGFGPSGPQLAHYIARNLSIYGIAKRRLRRWLGG